MATTFYCPGTAHLETEANRVTCSETLHVTPAGDPVKLSELVGEGIYWGLVYWSLFFIFNQIKKAIEH